MSLGIFIFFGELVLQDEAYICISAEKGQHKSRDAVPRCNSLFCSPPLHHLLLLMPCGLHKAGSCSAGDRSDGMGDAQAFDVRHNTANDYINRPIYSTSYGCADLLFVVRNQGREMKKSYKPLQNGTTYLCLCGGKARMHCMWCAYCKGSKYFPLAGGNGRNMQGRVRQMGPVD